MGHYPDTTPATYFDIHALSCFEFFTRCSSKEQLIFFVIKVIVKIKIFKVFGFNLIMLAKPSECIFSYTRVYRDVFSCSPLFSIFLVQFDQFIFIIVYFKDDLFGVL